jgi:hypothetical protein
MTILWQEGLAASLLALISAARYYILKRDKLVLIYPKSDIGNKVERYWK